MSAWIVNKLHIDYLVTALIAAEIVPGSQADETGRLLWRENLKSVACRYPADRDGDRPGPHGFRDRHVDEYRWQETALLTPGGLAKTIGCYDYQSCEHPTWEKSEAYQLMQRLAPPGQPKYDDTVPWGWGK